MAVLSFVHLAKGLNDMSFLPHGSERRRHHFTNAGFLGVEFVYNTPQHVLLGKNAYRDIPVRYNDSANILGHHLFHGLENCLRGNGSGDISGHYLAYFVGKHGTPPGNPFMESITL